MPQLRPWESPPRQAYLDALAGKSARPVLRSFQREGVEFLKRHQYRALIADAPGLGKTIQVLVAMKEARRALVPAVVVCPSSVAWNWRREAEKWAPSFSCQVVEGADSPIEPGVDITVCPWDLLARRLGDLLALNPRLAVLDEAHYAKNPGSQRGKAALALCEVCAHRIPLSGTPLVNDVEELEAVRALTGRRNPPMIRRLLEDVAKDVPPKTRIILDVAIPADAMREYRKAEKDFEVYLTTVLGAAEDSEDRVAKAMTAPGLVKVGYLRQILGRAKAMSAAAWIVRQIRAGEPPVVFCEHQDVLDTLAQVLDKAKISYGRLDGGTSRRARQDAIDGFQSGKYHTFLGSQAAREGITLTRARHALFVERWWHPAAEEQAEDRIRRIGQRFPTFIWFMQVPDTYDERMAEIVEKKRGLVKKHVGSHPVQRQDATGLLGEWLRGQPAAEADLTMPDFPDLPRGTQVQAFLFSAKNWTPDTVERWLKIHGYTFRFIYEKKGKVIAELRAAVHFRPGTFRPLRLSPDFGAIVGYPQRARKTVSNRQRKPRRLRR